MPSVVRASLDAIRRGRVAILTIAATYALSLAAGIAMVSSGNAFALERRDESRLGDAGSAAYYLVTLALQLIPYSIAGGMGVYLGVGAWRAFRRPRTDTWLGLPTDRLRDVAFSYIAVAPLFLIASLWEFFLG